MKNRYVLKGKLTRNGYDWWWHSFTGRDAITNEERSFFIEYFIINPSLSKKVIYGKDGLNKPSYFLIKAGSWGKNKKQLNKFYNISDVKISRNRNELNIKGSDFYLTNNSLLGNIKNTSKTYLGDKGTMKWNLTVKKKLPFDVGYGTSNLLISMRAFEMYWHVQGINCEYEGEVEYEGRKYIVSKKNSFGYQDKNFGSNFTSPWIWLSSCSLKNKDGIVLNDSGFDFGGGKPRIFHIPLNNVILGCLYIQNKKYEYNFSKFWKYSKIKFDCYEDDEKVYWNIVAKNIKSRLELNISCIKDDMLFINYEDPNGIKNYQRLFNGGNGVGTLKLYNRKNELIQDLIIDHVGCEYGKYHKDGDLYYKK